MSLSATGRPLDFLLGYVSPKATATPSAKPMHRPFNQSHAPEKGSLHEAVING
jgi:hypothetical protein